MLRTVITTSIQYHVPAGPSTAEAATMTKRTNTATPAALLTTERNAVMGVGAPSYVSGAQNWNGTEAILINQPGVEYFSVHQYPCYPGTGSSNAGINCFNYPVAPDESRETRRSTLTRALGDLRSFRPDLVAVSAGFDAYLRDPLADGALLVEDFHWLGKELRGLNTPFFSLLEGGYSSDLPDLILAYLKGISGG